MASQSDKNLTGHVAYDQQLNLAAIKLIDDYGNDSPTEQQINLAEQILMQTALQRQLDLSDDLTEREIARLIRAACSTTSEEVAKQLKIKTPAKNNPFIKLKHGTLQ